MAGIAAEPLLRSRDLDLVAWTGEQYAARVDQVQALLGCGPRTVQRVVARLRDAGLVEVRRLLVGDPAWVIPTTAGLRACGVGYGQWCPRLGLLAHVAAVNDVRLHVKARSPQAEWVCERAVARERESQREHLPDAVIAIDGKRIAVEVELTVKSKRRVRGILGGLRHEYDATLYYCAPGPHRQLSAMAASGEWPGLGVRELPSRRKDSR